ncbi:MAG: mevalonate kinase [Chlorobi bacterium]|nr:mevalonate kinase [Chlorobiota bacterium]
MNKTEKKFCGKILMFGEYALIFGSGALSVPYKQKYGRLTFAPDASDNTVLNFREHLNGYFSHLKEIAANKKLLCRLRLDDLENDITNGLVFDSSLPIGYGLGSSGALVAALYDRYAENPIPVSHDLTTAELLTLKQQFAQLESYFHGTSSGLDPLVSYLQEAILVEGKDKLRVVNLPRGRGNGNEAVFLLDSGSPGETQPLVNWFTEECKRESFCNKVDNDFIPLTNGCIQSFLDDKTDVLFSQLKQLSQFTLSHLRPMVPGHLNNVWEKGISSDACYLKLCGSGGGGMMLGFSRDMEKARELLNGFELTVVRYF